jgi:hypothetical protein
MNGSDFIEFRVEVPLKVVWNRSFNTKNFKNFSRLIELSDRIAFGANFKLIILAI